MFVRIMETRDKSLLMAQILQVVAERFCMEDSLTAAISNVADTASLVNLDPQQVLPFNMDITDTPQRHIMAAKVSGPVKMLILLTQVLQTAFECYAHNDLIELESDAQQMRSPRYTAALLNGQHPSTSTGAATTVGAGQQAVFTSNTGSTFAAAQGTGKFCISQCNFQLFYVHKPSITLAKGGCPEAFVFVSNLSWGHCSVLTNVIRLNIAAVL